MFPSVPVSRKLRLAGFQVRFSDHHSESNHFFPLLLALGFNSMSVTFDSLTRWTNVCYIQPGMHTTYVVAKTDLIICWTYRVFSVILMNTWSSSPQSWWSHLDSRSVFALYPIIVKLTSFLTQQVGYNYVNIDDCYSEKERDKSGNIVASAHHLSQNARSF